MALFHDPGGCLKESILTLHLFIAARSSSETFTYLNVSGSRRENITLECCFLSSFVLGVVVLDSIYIHHSAGRSPNKSTNFFSSHFDGSLFSFFLLALLSGTLRTIQRAACDGEMLTLRCPLGTAVSIQLAQYGRPAPGISLCPSSSVDPSSNGHLNNDSCPLTPQMQVRKPTNIKSSQ